MVQEFGESTPLAVDYSRILLLEPMRVKRKRRLWRTSNIWPLRLNGPEEEMARDNLFLSNRIALGDSSTCNLAGYEIKVGESCYYATNGDRNLHQ